MLRAILTKKRVHVTLMVILMVMTYVIPSGFHLYFCNGQEGHWEIAKADCTDMGKFFDNEEESLYRAINDCCTDFSDCNTEISCRPALIRTTHTAVSPSVLLYFTQPVVSYFERYSKTYNPLFLQPEVHSGKLPFLKTIIIQV
jgi:hypothetical protein